MTTEKATMSKAAERAARSDTPGRIYLIIGAAILYGLALIAMIVLASGM